MPSIDEVVSMLSRYRQRATYEALGAVVGKPAQSVMTGRPHSHLDSWVVSKLKGTPTGYLPHEIDPALLERAHIISAGDELVSWLGSPS
jgi:hypothetical protein